MAKASTGPNVQPTQGAPKGTATNNSGSAPARLGVSGCRSYTDERAIDYFLKRGYTMCEHLYPEHTLPPTLVHGAAAGVDTIAGQYANLYGWGEVQYPADWAKHGKKAGVLRNIEMFGKPGAPGVDVLVAFPALPRPGANSGTNHAIGLALAAGIPTCINLPIRLANTSYMEGMHDTLRTLAEVVQGWGMGGNAAPIAELVNDALPAGWAVPVGGQAAYCTNAVRLPYRLGGAAVPRPGATVGTPAEVWATLYA